MPRRHRRATVPAEPARGVGAERREAWRGADYLVRAVTGAAATKPYRCPGCDQQILPGRPHLVVWPADAPDADDRRHWHSACWSARERRAPRTQRSRSAPRY